MGVGVLRRLSDRWWHVRGWTVTDPSDAAKAGYPDDRTLARITYELRAAYDMGRAEEAAHRLGITREALIHTIHEAIEAKGICDETVDGSACELAANAILASAALVDVDKAIADALGAIRALHPDDESYLRHSDDRDEWIRGCPTCRTDNACDTRRAAELRGQHDPTTGRKK